MSDIASLMSDDGWMETFTGVRFNLADPKPEDVCIEDIAHALALQTRFNGHCGFFWSVGQHSLLADAYLDKQNRTDRIVMLGLLHDAAEAYTGDVTSPVKALCPQVRELEARVMVVVYEGLGIEPPNEHEYKWVKEADIAAITIEAGVVMSSRGEWWGLPEVAESVWAENIESIYPESMDIIEMTFLKEYYRLKGLL